MLGTGRAVLIATAVAVSSAGGVYLALGHGGALVDRLTGRDGRWVEYSCHGTKEVSEHIGAERITHAGQEVTERVFLDARSISIARNDGIQTVVTDFIRDGSMAEWRSDTRTDDDGSDGRTLSTVGNLFFATATLMIRDIETVHSGGWDHQRSSLLSGSCRITRSGRY